MKRHKRIYLVEAGMARLDDLEFHDGCDDTHCPKCQKANAELESMMYDALGNTHDWLGKYHSWLVKQSIQPETAGGWWTREALNDRNVQRFIEERAEAEQRRGDE